MTNRTVLAALPSRAPRREGKRPNRADEASRVFGQSVLFSGATVLVSILAMGCSALAARSLSTDEFGSFSFAKSLLLFLALVFEFGTCSVAGRRLTQVSSEGRSRVMGASLLLFVPIAIGFSLFLVALSPIVDRIFNVHIATALLLTAPFAFAYPLRQQYALQLSRGVGRLHVYSLTTLLGQALFLVALGVDVALGGAHGVPAVLTLQSAMFAAASVVAVVWLRPVLRGARAYVPSLISGVRRWGFELYVGRVLAIGTYNMDVLMLAAFADARSVGYYALAGSIGSVSALPTTGFTSALFPRMVQEDRIDRRRLALAYGIGSVSLLAVWLVARPLVTLIFSARYAEAATLALPLTLASSLMGVTTVYSTFLSAHAHGRDLRDAGFVLTGSNVILNFALIPPFGATGAAWASAAAVLANLAAHIGLYRRSFLRAGRP